VCLPASWQQGLCASSWRHGISPTVLLSVDGGWLMTRPAAQPHPPPPRGSGEACDSRLCIDMAMLLPVLLCCCRRFKACMQAA
jgi:hypothetical protein